MDEGYDAINVARADDLAAGRPLRRAAARGDDDAAAAGRGPAPAEPDGPTGAAS